MGVKVGDEAVVDAVLGAPGTKARPTRVRVSVVEGPPRGEGEGEGERQPAVGTKYRVAWVALGYPTWSLRPERVQEIEVLEGEGDVRCKFSSWETMAGPMAGVVKMVAGAGIDEAQGRFVGELRGWCEGDREGNGVNGGVGK